MTFDKIPGDRELLENLEKVLAGEENQIPETLDDDTKSTLDIARKMASMREPPSEEFSKNLKAQLIHRLAEQERKERSRNQTFLFWEIPRRTMWQGTIAAAMALIIVVIILLINN